MSARRILVVLVVAALAALAAIPAVGTAADRRARGDDRIDGRFIVVYRGAVQSPGGETDRRERRDGFRSERRYSRALKGFSARLSPAQVRRLEADPEVAFVSPDRPVKATASVPLAAGEPTPPTGVRRMEAGTATTTREASSTNVAVIDTGVDLDHPDLNAADGKSCSGTASADDDNGHGTHVAGSIAARNNGSGVVGVAPGTKVYAAKVLNSAGSGSQSSVICGIDWVTANAAALNIKVANMSLGGVGAPVGTCATTTDPQHKAMCNSIAAGVTYVVAAGNDGWDFDYAPQPDTPAAYPEALTVSALTDSDGKAGGTGGAPGCRTTEVDDRYAGFSNFAKTAAGAAHLIAAPGTCINSTWPGGGYNTISGTSMATPHVAGAVALCHGEGSTDGPCAGRTPAQIVQQMRGDAQAHTTANPSFGFAGDPTRPVSGRTYGYLNWSGGASGGGSPPPPPPAATTPAAVTGATSARTTSTATVGGSVNPGGQATTYRFEYGTTTAYGQSTASASAGSGTSNVSVSAGLSGLTPGTTYHYRLVASNASGSSIGADATFTTTSRRTASPASATVESGSFRAGSAGNLRLDDGLFYEVNSTSGGTRTSSWYGTFTGVPSTAANLRVSAKTRNSRTCTQTLATWRWSDSRWIQLDSRSVGTTQIALNGLAPGSGASPYVSSGGQVRVRVRCTTTNGSFVSSGNLLGIAYDG